MKKNYFLRGLNSKKSIPKLVPGFMLLELLVSISVATVLMAVVLFGYRTFSNRLAISAASQQVAVAVRQAQTYALSAKELTTGSGDFDTSYGVAFSLSDPSSYYLFADKNDDGLYSGDSSCLEGSECIKKEFLKANINISSFCGTNYSDVKECPPSGAQMLNIVFKRPDPDAQIKFSGISGLYKSSELVFTMPTSVSSGLSKVSVDDTGKIYATGVLPAEEGGSQPPSCPTDITSQFTITSTGFLYSRVTGNFSGTVFVKNNGSAVSGNTFIALSLPQNVSLVNKTGLTTCFTGVGKPYIMFSTSGIASGATINVPVIFYNPDVVLINWTGYVGNGPETP